MKGQPYSIVIIGSISDQAALFAMIEPGFYDCIKGGKNILADWRLHGGDDFIELLHGDEQYSFGVLAHQLL